MPESQPTFEMLFSREYQPVVRSMYAFTGDRAAAEDLAQEAFARLFQAWDRISSYERPDAWVRRVAINLALSARRRRRYLRRPEPVPGPSTEPLDVRRAILQLPGMQRAVVVLYYLEDRPISDVAQIVGCAESTVRVHLHRARHRLGGLLREAVPDAR
jgi:RNA polymerase sigma-70 factor (ECF subfamily)